MSWLKVGLSLISPMRHVNRCDSTLSLVYLRARVTCYFMEYLVSVSPDSFILLRSVFRSTSGRSSRWQSLVSVHSTGFPVPSALLGQCEFIVRLTGQVHIPMCHTTSCRRAQKPYRAGTHPSVLWRPPWYAEPTKTSLVCHP